MLLDTIPQNAATQQHKLAAYFSDGCKPVGQFQTGMEVEHFVTHADGTPATFTEIQSLLKSMQPTGGTPIWIDGLYMGYNCPDYGISLEPACQLEISIMPQNTVAALMQIYETFQHETLPRLSAGGFVLSAVGCHPTRRAAELPLIPKNRYRLMDRYFQTSGHHGINMMRATASTQISVDYFSEQDFVRKYRAANLLTPMLALLTDNTPIYEATPNMVYSRRTLIWNDVDPARCGVIPCLMDAGFGFEAYAAWLVRQPLIVARHGDATEDAGSQTAAELYGPALTKAEIEHVLSMFFFDSRLKNYIEIRVADSMPPRYIAAYAQLVTAIFGSDPAIEAILNRYAGATVGDIESGKTAMCADGYGAAVYGRPMAEELQWLLTLAEQYPGSEMLAPFKALVAQQRTIREVLAENQAASLTANGQEGTEPWKKK